MVEYQGHAPRGGHSRMWAYGYADLAKLLGTTEAAMGARVKRGWDPGSMEAVCLAWAAAKNARAQASGDWRAALKECVPGSNIFLVPDKPETF